MTLESPAAALARGWVMGAEDERRRIADWLDDLAEAALEIPGGDPANAARLSQIAAEIRAEAYRADRCECGRVGADDECESGCEVGR